MTFFLPKDTATVPRPSGPDVGLSSYGGGLGATFTKAQMENGVNFMADRATKSQKSLVAEPAARRIGIESLNAMYEAKGAGYDYLRPKPKTVDDFLAMHGPDGVDMVLDAAREAAKASPDTWADLDVSAEGIDKAVNTRFQAELRDAQTAIAMSPGIGFVPELLTSMVAMTADIRNLPFLLMGGTGGSMLSVMGREGALNAAAEAAFLPSQFEMAERLNIPDPNVPAQLATAFGAGAVLGGAIEAGARAIRYYRGRNALPPSTNPMTDELVVDAAEKAIINGDNPLEAVQRVLDQSPPPVARVPAREPLLTLPAEQTAPLAQPEAQPAPVEPVTTEVLPPREGEAPQSDAELIALIDRSIDDAEAVDAKRPRPFLSWLKEQGAVTKGQINKAIKEGRPPPTPGERFQIDPNGPIGKELKALGINARSLPGLFKKGGRQDLDNLVASEMEDMFPGIMGATGTRYGETYLDRQGVIDLIKREADGDSTWLQSRADVEKMRAEAERFREGITSPVQDYLDLKAEPDGFFVDLNVYDFEGGGGATAIRRDLEAYLASRNINFDDYPQDLDEIVRELSARGGDAYYLIERALGRSADELETLTQRIENDDFIPFGDDAPPRPDRPNEPAAGEPQADAGNAGGSGADQGGLPGAVEQTQVRRPVDPDNAEFEDTRGRGRQFHGATKPIDRLSGDFFGSEGNIYGNGFYSTDAIAIGAGYSRARRSTTGVVYEIEEVGQITPFDMEQPVPEWLRVEFRRDQAGDWKELFDDAMGENPSSVRELYDEIRGFSSNYGIPRYEVQEIFDALGEIFASRGFNALEHVGGLNTKKSPHQVRIYLKPSEQIEILPVDLDAYKPKAEPASEQTQAGQQLVIPGAERVDPSGEAMRLAKARAVVKAQQSKMRTSTAQARVEDEAGGLFGGAQTDLFSDPLDAKARVAHDQIANDLRDKIELDGDLMVDVGTGPRNASSLLDELDADDDFLAVLDACGKPGGTTGGQ